MKIKGGYILQPRSIDESEIMKHPPIDRELWLYLLRKVNYCNAGQFKRGTAFFQFDDIQKDLEWFVGYRRETYTKPQITKSLRRLCERNMIATAKATRGIIITVCKYDYYQDPQNYEGNGEITTKESRNHFTDNTISKEREESKELKKAHTHSFEVKISSCAREERDAAALLDWIEKQAAPVAKMEFPLTLAQAIKIVSRYSGEDAGRIFLAMCNKGATERCKSAYTTFNAYAANDIQLREKATTLPRNEYNKIHHEGIQKGFVSPR